MPRPLSVLFTILALSLSGSRAAAAAPDAPARSHARPTAEAKPRDAAAAAKARGATKRAPRARLAKDDVKGHRPRAGDAGPRSPEPATKKAAPQAPASSVGHPNEGRLEGGVRLDTSRKDIRVVPAYAGADVRWGLPALVGMIERAARGVAKRFPGAVLGVGDLSRQRGGDVHRHNSHESGRDVDLGFYALDARGKQVHAPVFLRFDARLVSTNVPGARFDLPRNWLLVQHLLTDPRARVSHIFISDPLRSALIAHAKRIGVSRALLVRAQLAMMQPTGAEAHDDHMHVRISCPAAMRGSCIELAKNAPSHARARMARKTDRALRTPSPPARAEAARPPKAAAAPAPERPREAGAGRRDPEQPSRRDDRRPEREARRAAPRAAADAEALPLAASRAAAQQPMGGLDLSFLRPAASEVEIEADSDGADASGALDDSGVLKITD
ncbi:penicillin-insensitive murein endopeptidase [Sorangium atrum]|uniref:Penicillin-insensitive murein endopeptidase n=1 Tax=Sorangium atrum TaxID=2995308 RepID=A0ABT5BUX6_9BACT|nr:penicillin-insensitive murein endopeptidase [Sorangium aterium]MDC0677951.1 penicillin-insensitive murein endopeptidase [Sorangium aterium]